MAGPVLNLHFGRRLPCLSFFFVTKLWYINLNSLFVMLLWFQKVQSALVSQFFLIFRGKETIDTGSSCFLASFLTLQLFFILFLCCLKFLYCILQYNWLCLNLFHSSTILHLHLFWVLLLSKAFIGSSFLCRLGNWVSQESCLQFDIFNILSSQNCLNFDRIDSRMLQLLRISYFGEVERVCLPCANLSSL